jgi:hypothetical protein
MFGTGGRSQPVVHRLKVRPFFGAIGGHGVKVLATCFPNGSTILTFGGIASFLPFQFAFAQREWIAIFSRASREKRND